jgi:uncharacterized low-complexity protein
MKRILTALIASAALLMFAAPASAQAGAMSHATQAPKMSKSSAMTTAAACPKGQSMVKGYKKKDGTMVKSYCRKSK